MTEPLTRETLLRILNDYAPDINGLKRIGLVGSYAREDYSKTSDVDLVFDLDNVKTDNTLAETVITLRLILMDQFRKKLDVIKYDNIFQNLNMPLNNHQRGGYEKMLNDLIWIWEDGK